MVSQLQQDEQEQQEEVRCDRCKTRLDNDEENWTTVLVKGVQTRSGCDDIHSHEMCTVCADWLWRLLGGNNIDIYS